MRFNQTPLPSWIQQFQPSFFDPIYICAQICALQSAFYLNLSILLWFTNLFSNSPLNLDGIFGESSYSWNQSTSWGLVFLVWLNAGFGCVWVVMLIQKSKQVLDFVTTLHLFHFLFTWIYNSAFPWTSLWYLAYLGSLCIMVIVGERACIQRETSPIYLTSSTSSLPTTTTTSSSSSPSSSLNSFSTFSFSSKRWFTWRLKKKKEEDVHTSDEQIQLTSSSFNRTASSSSANMLR